jgi:hypothetical protein
MDVVVLLAVTVSGLVGLNVYVVIAAAAVLTAISARRKVEIARAYRDVGAGRILVGALFLSFTNSVVFSLLCYGLGRGVSLIS